MEAHPTVAGARSAAPADTGRVALFLFGCDDPAALRRTLARIPVAALDRLSEVFVVTGPRGLPAGDPDPWPGRARPEVGVLRGPREQGHGRARKTAFEHALRDGIDRVVLMAGDGTHPPEALPALLDRAVGDREAFVIASRGGSLASAAAGGGRRWRRFAAGWLDRLLGMRLDDWSSAFRAIAVDALAAIPFQLDSDDRRLDTEILLQMRALGVTPCEVATGASWREGGAGETDESMLARALATGVGYRLHQLHATRRGRYLVDHGTRYMLKRSATGSHVQIVSAIRPGTRVLDLGCSQGLLAGPLADHGVRVTGVDVREAPGLSPDLAEFFERDLERPLDLPIGRVFDYVICADVIEHLRNREELLRSVRRYLRADGRLVISTPNIAIWFYRLSLLAGRFEYGPRGILDRTHVHLFTRDTFRREVAAAGFRVVTERVTALPFELVFRSTGRSPVVSGIARLYHALARAWPEMFAYQFILEAEITTFDDEAIRPGGSSPAA